MHVYIHIYEGGGNRKYGSWLPEQAKQLKMFDHAAIYHNKQANEVIQFQSSIMHGIYINTFKNTFSRTLGKKSTLFPLEVKSWYLLRF